MGLQTVCHAMPIQPRITMITDPAHYPKHLDPKFQSAFKSGGDSQEHFVNRLLDLEFADKLKSRENTELLPII
jgi:hypothetical protein